MVNTAGILITIATHLGAVAIGSAITLIAYKIGQRSDRLSKLIDRLPQIIQGATNIIGSVRDMIESERLSRTRSN